MTTTEIRSILSDYGLERLYVGDMWYDLFNPELHEMSMQTDTYGVFILDVDNHLFDVDGRTWPFENYKDFDVFCQGMPQWIFIPPSGQFICMTTVWATGILSAVSVYGTLEQRGGVVRVRPDSITTNAQNTGVYTFFPRPFPGILPDMEHPEVMETKYVTLQARDLPRVVLICPSETSANVEVTAVPWQNVHGDIHKVPLDTEVTDYKDTPAFGVEDLSSNSFQAIGLCSEYKEDNPKAGIDIPDFYLGVPYVTSIIGSRVVVDIPGLPVSEDEEGIYEVKPTAAYPKYIGTVRQIATRIGSRPTLNSNPESVVPNDSDNPSDPEPVLDDPIESHGKINND